jgi:putative peptidoglycan lipid II flippase
MTSLASSASTDTGRPRKEAAGIARGAAVIAGFTILARIFGLLRTVVFAQTVGATCLGTAYVTANQVPNLVYELVLGGALASVMVPVLARSAERSAADPAEKARVVQISSALLTWTALILVPIALIIVAAAGPIASLLNPANANAHCGHAAVVATTATMLRVFAPQAVLYGLSVVLFSLLQAYRRFVGFALAPLVSSLVLIATYLAFVPLGGGLPLARLSLSAQLELSVGTTLGIAALVLVAAIPTWRLHLGLRPALRLPPGVASRVGGLALVGLVEVVVGDVDNLVVIGLANGRGTTGALVIFNYASQVFNSLNAVLALSIVLSAFPVLAARDGAAFDRTCAGSTRAVIQVACLGMAITGAVSIPAAHVLAKQPAQVSELIWGFALFAPGLAGTAVIANLSRVMLAIGRLKVAAAAVAGSWLLVIVAQVVLAELAPPRLVVAALALGYTIGHTAATVPVLVVTRRIRGPASVEGVGRSALVGLAGAAAGAVTGVVVTLALPAAHRLIYAGVGVVAACGSVALFGIVSYALGSAESRAMVKRLRKVRRLGTVGQALSEAVEW